MPPSPPCHNPNTTNMIPSLGRIVHYVLAEGQNKGSHRAAQISAVYPDTKNAVSEASAVDLTITLQAHEERGEDGLPKMFRVAEHVFQDPEGRKAGTWHECEPVAKAVPAAKAVAA